MLGSSLQSESVNRDSQFAIYHFKLISNNNKQLQTRENTTHGLHLTSIFE